MRLYVTGKGVLIEWTITNSLKEAREKLGEEARVATDEDCRYVYTKARFWEIPSDQIRERLGVSRQAVDGWRKRGGMDIPTRTQVRESTRNKRIREVLAKKEKISARDLAITANVNYKKVKDYAERAGLELTKWKRRPSDEELIEMQRGRTWRELADALGLRLSTLRTYIYRNKALSAALAAVRKKALTGKPAQKTLDTAAIRALYDKGMTPYMISETLKVEQMSVRYWTRRWKKEEEAANDKARNKRKAARPVEGSNAGAVRKQQRHPRPDPGDTVSEGDIRPSGS